MRRSFWLAGLAVMTLSTGAIAQEMNQPDMQPGMDMPQESPTAPSASGQPAPAPADPNSTVPTGQSVPPGTPMMPADTTVPTDPAAPAGTDANPVTLRGNVNPPPPPKENYPTCTRQIQDSCRNPGGK